jgi:hypothetical protein
MIGLQHPGNSPFGALTRRLVAGLKPGPARLLPSLADVHPGQPTGGRWIGLRTVPTECVRGTASASGSRAPDFRPLVGHEPADWGSRWSRLLSAARDQAILPPVELLRAGGDYWVVDGHNRVALARRLGQLWIDADVTEVDVGSNSAASASPGRRDPLLVGR